MGIHPEKKSDVLVMPILDIWSSTGSFRKEIEVFLHELKENQASRRVLDTIYSP